MCGECTWEKGLLVEKLRLQECHRIKGLAVVIDVIRAFSTSAFAFAAGVEKIIVTGEVEEAFELRRRFPEALLAGEVDGLPIKGFDFGNSPVEISQADLAGKTLIFRTSSGTQGIVKSKKASRILVSSFSVAEATLKRIKKLAPYKFACVITGTKRGGWEDLALADYFESKLENDATNPAPFIERVIDSPSGQMFLSGESPHFSKLDLQAVCEVDRFNFAMEVFKEDGLQVIRPVNEFGQVVVALPNGSKLA